jgi:hypothetical protein
MSKQILFRNLQWSVTHDFDLVCTTQNYEISHETLSTIDWITHMKEKSWCNDFYFKQAIEYALNNIGNGK